MSHRCINCSTDHDGVFCPACGEKILTVKDFRVGKYFGSFFTSLTNLDTKFYRTAKAFFLRPGQLSRDSIVGLRKPYLTPIQIFLIVSILFFVFIRDFDIFYVPAKWFFEFLPADSDTFLNRLTMDKMAELDLTRTELALKYDVTVSNYAKAFLFLIVPALALASFLCRPKTVPEFGKHLIFATHNLSFAIFWFLILLSIAFQLPDWTPRWLMMSLGFGGEYLYFVLANRRTWDDGWLRAIWSGFLQLLIMTMFLAFYRGAVSYVTLATL